MRTTLAVLLAASAVPTATAQDRPRPEGSFALEEVIVTARKRDETLLDVPLTISVLTTKDIEIRDLKDMRDVVNYTPGFYFGGPSGGANDRSSARLLLRGMQVNTDVQTRQGGMVFIDGAPILGAQIGAVDNAERIETVKGPQSAYFGRSTFGGAINVITRKPSMDRWHGRADVQRAGYNTVSYGVQAEGPVIADKLAIRFNASTFGNDGHYHNAANGRTLGDRKTNDAALTVFAKPNERFDAKLRLHYWVDDDGPSASLGFGRLNGEDVFNCYLGGTASRLANGNNWVCGEPRFPTAAEINVDTTMDPVFRSIIAGDATACPSCGLLLGKDFLTDYGLRREAREVSLIMNYRFGNDMMLSSITASHGDDSARIEDLDRKATAQLGIARDTKFLSHRQLSDFSQEIRLASPGGGRWQWLIGGSYGKIEQLSLGVTRNSQGVWSSGTSGTALNKVETTGLFGSVSYKLGDPFTLSLEGRRQDDKVTDGAKPFTQLNGGTSAAGTTLSDTFRSFTPRLILDYQATNAIKFYGIYAEGTRPGEFNSTLISPLINQTVLDCIGRAIYNGIAIPEEDLKNFEIGMKGRFWDGRATLTAAAYYAKWRNQHNRGQTNCPDVNGVIRTFQTTGLGGSSNLQGLELEFKVAATEHITLEGTLAYNDTDILSRDCADCLLILGFREIAGLHKEFSRYPKVNGTLSGTYERPLADGSSWYLRGDYVHRGNQWATEANVTETGVAKRLNLRAGVRFGNGIRLEVYGTNVTNDKTFDGYQRFDDQAFPGFQMLTAGLPNKPNYGVRATYEFDFSPSH
jgi:iron complex outermembrane receptor protein